MTRAALIAATGCWGIGTVVSKQVVDDVTPLTVLPVQLPYRTGLTDAHLLSKY